MIQLKYNQKSVKRFWLKSVLPRKSLTLLKENSRHCKKKQNSQGMHIVKHTTTNIATTTVKSGCSALEKMILS